MKDRKKHEHNFFKGRPYFPEKKTYVPWYEDTSDYNTNAKSYYDYLARFNHLVGVMVRFINRLLNRNIEFHDTESIDFTKDGDWIDNGNCEPNHYNDIIKIKADVITSNQTEQITLNKITGSPFLVPNGTVVKNDGVWSPDYRNALNAINKDIGDLKNGLQKILDNLYSSGAITNNNINNYEFVPNRNIASGTINLFGGTPDGNSFIRTNKNETENDITAGY